MISRSERSTDVHVMARNGMTVHVRLKLSALWASVMFCYIYADYFKLYQPDILSGMAEGQGPLAGQGGLLGAAVLMAVPSVMIFLPLVLPMRINRWTNIVLGVLYSLIIAAGIAVPGTWAFYIFFGFIEIALTLTVAVLAWRSR